MRGSAIFSPCGKYRYLLSRTWHESGPRDLWIMLNPSRANAERGDMTVSKCIGFSQTIGSAGFDVINLLGYVTPHPLDLLRVPDPTGPENDLNIRYMAGALTGAKYPARVICAWGSSHRLISHLVSARTIQVLGILHKAGIDIRESLWCLGRTASGSPRHPSRLAYATPLEKFA